MMALGTAVLKRQNPSSGPLEKLDLANEHRLQPLAIGHSGFHLVSVHP
jgi:hypothetical protein